MQVSFIAGRFFTETSGKPQLKNIVVGCHALLQGNFLTQGSNPCLSGHLHWQFSSLPIAPLMCLGIIFKVNIPTLHLDILPIILGLIILS